MTAKIGAGLSTLPGTSDAATQAAREASAALAGPTVDLAFLFLSPAHLDEAAEAAAAVRDELAPDHLVGCVAEGIVARDRELEDGPGAAVWAGSLPGAEVECFHTAALETEDGIAIAGFPELEEPTLVALLVDPFTFPAGPFLARLNEDHPGLPLVGGIASGAGEPGAQALILDGEIHEEGAVGVILSGVPVLTVVSQGCAPIGGESVITRAEDNVIYELAGRPALERLRTIVAGLSPEQRVLASQGVLAGLVIDENRSEYGRDDFLIRGLLGADEESGAIAVGEPVRVGQTLRFHVRDAESADTDLREALRRRLRGASGRKATGALLFTCNGRGTHMFPEPHHDAQLVGESLGSNALAGFFCGGEIGPVGGRAFLHGFTATLAVFLES